MVDHPCRCGGTLVVTRVPITLFKQDFGLVPAETCTGCKHTFLSQETMEELEREANRRGLPKGTRRGPAIIPITDPKDSLPAQ